MSLSVADRWFEWERVGEGVTHIWEPHVVPFMRCNIWHVRGRERDLLIDSGMGMRSLKEAIAALLEKPVAAVATHTHFDHVGSHHEFAERLVHPAEAEILARPSRAATLIDKYVDENAITALPCEGFAVEDYAIAPAPPTRLIDEGAVLDLGDRSFEVLHLPGHSPGSIGLYEAASGILFSGDAVYDAELLDDCYHSDIAAYVATMERLRALPVRVVHGGHAPSFGPDRMRAIIDDYLARRGAR